MDIFKYAAITLLSVTAVVIIFFALKSRKPVKLLVLNALLGLGAFAAVELVSRFTGVHIPLNEWTAGGAASLGIPAVCGFLLLRVIFGP